MNKIISFDVFDTLIMRTVAEPKSIFRLIQEILSKNPEYFDIGNTLRDNFSVIRINAEQFISENYRINKNKKYISLDDIYNYIQTNYCLSNSQTEKIKKLEIDTEQNSILPIWKNIELLKNYYDKGYQILLVSDMYLSSEQIRTFLVIFDTIFWLLL